MTALPRVAHFIYLDQEIPAWRQECIDAAAELNPGLEVRVWRDVSEFGLLHNKAAFADAARIAPPAPAGNPWQVRSNILRFEIMLRHGGLFLDTDVMCVRSLEPLLDRIEAEGHTGMLGWEIQSRWLGEAVIACVPGAPFMRRIVDNLEAWSFRRRGKPATITVGPQYITPLLRASDELADVLVMPQVAFYPARHDQPELGDALCRGEGLDPDTWAVHLFGNFRRRKALA